MRDGSGFQVGADAPEHYQQQAAHFMTPFVEALIAAAVRTGDSVLDVACGTGFATRSAAEATGRRGTVHGIDLNPAMVLMAQSLSAADEYEIDWREASALELPFPDHSFDAVISQQGIQFFPDIPVALREMTRVGRSGGRMAATVWAPIEQSPFFAAETDVLIERCGSDPAASTSAFPSGGQDEIRRWFEAARLPGITMELVEAVVSLPPIIDFVPEHLKILPWSAGYFDLSEDAQRRALADLTDRLGGYATEDGIDVPFRSYVASLTL